MNISFPLDRSSHFPVIEIDNCSDSERDFWFSNQKQLEARKQLSLSVSYKMIAVGKDITCQFTVQSSFISNSVTLPDPYYLVVFKLCDAGSGSLYSGIVRL